MGTGAAAVGVVVPCKNEIATIETCLRSLRRLQPPVTRIVVVDNGSTDGSLEVAQRLADQVLRLPTLKIGAMRNAGAAAVGDCDVLAFVDADCEVLPTWLNAGLEALADADLVGSRTRSAPLAPWVARRWAAIEASQAHADSLAWSQHLLVRAAVFRRVGGFDERLATGEDGDLSARVRATGGTVRLVEGMVAIHHGFPKSLAAFLRRERWHTSSPGWFAGMSTKSRSLVILAAAWLATSVASLLLSAAGGAWGPVLYWAGASAVTLLLVGAVAARSPRHALPDGALLSLWALVRASRLPRELAAGAR